MDAHIFPFLLSHVPLSSLLRVFEYSLAPLSSSSGTAAQSRDGKGALAVDVYISLWVVVLGLSGLMLFSFSSLNHIVSDFERHPTAVQLYSLLSSMEEASYWC